MFKWQMTLIFYCYYWSNDYIPEYYTDKQDSAWENKAPQSVDNGLYH